MYTHNTPTHLQDVYNNQDPGGIGPVYGVILPLLHYGIVDQKDWLANNTDADAAAVQRILQDAAAALESLDTTVRETY